MISEKSLHRQKSKSDYLDRGKITRTTGTGMYQVGASKESADTEHHVCSVPRQIMRMLGTSNQRTYRRQEAVSTLLALVPTAQSIVQQLLCQDYVSCERVQRP